MKAKFFLLKIVLIFILLNSQLFSQLRPGKPEELPHRLFSLEDHIVPADSGYFNCYFTYKIAYDKLIFTKNGSQYTAAFYIDIEAVNTADDEIIRNSNENTVAVQDFNETESEDRFLEGLLHFKLKSGNYDFRSSVTIQNKKAVSPDFVIELSDSNKEILKPFIVAGFDSKNDVYVLQNDDAIPFSDSPGLLLIPASSDTVSSVGIKINQNEENVVNQTCNESFLSDLTFEEQNNRVVFRKNEKGKFRIFILKQGLKKLDEGFPKVSVEEKGSKPRIYSLPVKWLNKPLSLRNIDFSLKVMAKIQNDERLTKLEDKYDDEELLHQYWKRFDPDTSSKYNEIMDLFFTRVDNAIRKFSTVDRKNGALTDRGMVYIKYGPADFTERSFTKDNTTVEVWVYDKLNKKFVFKDKSGLGNYQLMN